MAVNPMLLEYLKRQGYEVPEKRDYAYEGANRDQMISGLSKLSSAAGSLGGKQADYLEPQDFSAQQNERAKFAQANPSDKLQEYLMKKLTEEKKPTEWRESSKLSPTGKRVYYDPYTREEREGLGVKEKPDETFNTLSEPVKQYVQGTAKKIADHTSIVNGIDAELRSMREAIARGDDDLAVVKGQNMLKILNSTVGQDAVGAEEARRLSGLLEFKLANFTGPGSFIGRDIEDFVRQAAEKSDDIKKQIMSNKTMMNQAMQKNMIPDVTPIASEVAPLKGAANKPGTPSQKVKVTNGKETLLIDPSDVENARRDGYQVVK